MRPILILTLALVVTTGCATQGQTGAVPGSDIGALGGTKWELVDWSPEERGPNLRSKTVEFCNNGRVITTTTFHDGSSERDGENYRVAGDTLIINQPGYLGDYRFRIDGDHLAIDTDPVRALLRRV